MDNIELTPELLEFAEIILDPVKFAEYHFGWRAYDYQAEVLRDSMKNIALRFARRHGKSDLMAIKAIHYTFTHGDDPTDPNIRPAVVLVTAPYEKQVKLIFKRIRELIRKSPELTQAVAHDIQNPDTITWKNGATIMGITAASKAGQGAAGARGQRADWIIIDEIDYMTDADIIALFAIAADANVKEPPGIIISSTPTGRRSKFFDICVSCQQGKIQVPPGRYVDEDGDWVAYYSPFWMHPNRRNDPEAIADYERQWKKNLGELGFIHEALAEFGEETVGVFDNKWIDRAKKEYLYPSKVKKGPLRVMGVDWDVIQATPTLCCLEYDPKAKNSEGEEGMFRVINHISISRDEEFLLDAAVKEIVEWNKKYQPEYIYVDKGYGAYQIETLHKMGKEAQKGDAAWNLHKRVVGVSFSENREIRDPGTGEIEAKPVKPWMVSQTQVLFGRDRIMLSKHDDVMWKQLENYRVEKVSANGQPRFTSVNEHAVDALMLCVLAVVDKFPELTKFITRFDPTRYMVIAPPLNTPSLNMNRINNGDINRDEGEHFATKRSPDKQTWYRVDDIRDVARTHKAADKTTYQMFKASPFSPRGLSKRGGRPVKRARF